MKRKTAILLAIIGLLAAILPACKSGGEPELQSSEPKELPIPGAVAA